ncbi:restriction endonuclease subunit S [Microcystis aeruginosa CS-558/01A06]|uniref:Restriction endonuclease subunit S n=1 Tax=Microcystis aeruginosa BLCC-F108 TaxID=2755317 RepID=A0A841UQN2_MICAE|nr:MULTISPECIES: restriction endonuclease subunit S [Microcystis]MBC1193301.1 restriction endonuclease subunit S [Microcystis aeruginosa BLCC-F108]MCA2592360.1 restriction endonuclease subunit S [Microcystis sp. M31BS1]MDB9409095.1 restriction endonuclease subunit S [Microcystis aeruginosa CS-558/01A06]
MKWSKVALGSQIYIKHGFAFKGEFFSDSGKYILLTPGNCHETGGLKLKGDKEKYYVGDVPEEFILHQNDLLVVMTDLVQSAPILGGALLIPENEKYLHNQRLGLVNILNQKELDKKYLYYLLNTHNYRSQIKGSATGTTVKHTAPERIYRCLVPLPSLQVQQKIADILSKYDDLIENNRRRIDLLERSARLLYKEWFVRLRFPGHEHTPIIDGIPEGWEKGQVSDFYKTASGGTPSRKNPDFFTGDINWVKTQELNNSFIFKTDEKITEEAIKNSSAKIFPAHTVLVAMYGATIGQTAILANSATTNQACCGLLPDCHIANYIHCFLFFRENKQILANLSLGAAQNNISQEIIRNFPMLLPSKKVMDIFWEFTNRIFEQIKILEQQNQKLKQARDILLPKLMNGEIEV